MLLSFFLLPVVIYRRFCLTGKRPADGGEQKTAPSNSTERDNSGLPLIVAPSYSNTVSKKVTQKELVISHDDKKEKRIDNDKNGTAPALSTASSFPTVQPKQDPFHRMQEKPISTSARGRSKDETDCFIEKGSDYPNFSVLIIMLKIKKWCLKIVELKPQMWKKEM